MPSSSAHLPVDLAEGRGEMHDARPFDLVDEVVHSTCGFGLLVFLQSDDPAGVVWRKSNRRY